MDKDISLGEPYYKPNSPSPPMLKTINKHYFIESNLLQYPTYCSNIYLCTDTRDHQKKVIKFVKIYNNDTERIINEVTIMGIVNHPNIIKLEDHFRSNIYYCLILPYTHHQSLLWFLRQYYRDGIPEDIAAIFMYQMLNAVNYLHELDIVHRDIKPDNFLIFDSSSNNTNTNITNINENYQQNRNEIRLPRTFTNFPKVVLTDFGFSTKIISGQKLDKPIGTAEYSAPEIHNNQKYDKSVDIWALGVSLFVMITGRFPFPDRKAFKDEFKMRVRNGRLNSRPLMYKSADVQDLIKKMCQLNPEKRITAKDALNHPWILSRKKTPIEEEVSNAIVQADDYVFETGL